MLDYNYPTFTSSLNHALMGLGLYFVLLRGSCYCISFWTIEYWNKTFLYNLEARGIFHNTLPREYMDYFSISIMRESLAWWFLKLYTVRIRTQLKYMVKYTPLPSEVSSGFALGNSFRQRMIVYPSSRSITDRIQLYKSR